MEKKTGIQELANALAKAKGIDGSEAEIFCRSVFDIISEYVVRDKLVKIKGIGTFKLVGVSDRESVNVNTGERIVIAGHTKLSFTPDAVLRDTVNKPFADFETTILSDNVSTEKMEHIPSEPQVAAEAKAAENTVQKPQVQSDNNVNPVEEVQEKAPNTETQPESVQSAAEAAYTSSCSHTTDRPSGSTSEAPVVQTANPVDAKTADNKAEKQVNTNQPMSSGTADTQKKSNLWLYVMLLAVLAVCLVLFFVYKSQSGRETPGTAQPSAIDKRVADSIAAVQAYEAEMKAKADSIAKAKADSTAKADSIARADSINRAVLEYYEKHPEQRWRLERALQRGKAKARRNRQ